MFPYAPRERYNCMNLKKTLAFLAVATASVSLAACGSSDNGGSSDGIVLANGAEPQNPLIPANTNENGGGRLTKLIYAGLVYYDNAGKTHMDVAESIEPNKDNTVFTVKLKDTKFSDGSPVTSKDFVDTWNYAVEKNFNNAYFFEMIKGYKEGAKSMEGLKVIDDSTFTIELAAPDADFVSRLGYDAYFPMHESAFADIDGYGENPIGNGPYMLDSWNHNVDATVVKNPEYTGERTAQNEGVKFTFYAQGDAAYADLLSGNLDVLDAIPDSAFSTYEQELAGRSTSDASARQVALTLNENLDHFSGEEGKLRRQAISHAINRDEITEVIYKGTATAAKDFTSPAIPNYNDSIKGSDVLNYDPAKAKELWDKADKISKFEGTLPISYNADGNNKAWVDAVANSIKNALGIESVGNPYPDFKSFRDEVKNRTAKGATRSSWSADYPATSAFIGPLYGTGAGNNDADYSNPELDSLIDKAASSSPEEAVKVNEQIQQILFEDLPAVPLWYPNTTIGWSESVNNVAVSWNGTIPFWEISKA